MNTSAFPASYLSTPIASTSYRAPPICSASSSSYIESSLITRRAALATLASTDTASLLLPKETEAAGDTLSEVSNDKYGYTFSAPMSGWTRTETTLNRMRELIVTVKDGTEGDANISMVSTLIAGDIKKLT